MDFLHRHYIHYPTMDINSKDDAVMRNRVNYIRQMTVGVKATKKSVDATIKNCAALIHADDKVALKQYLVLLKKAEDDRQNWIKIERGVGNTKHLEELIMGPGWTTGSRFRARSVFNAAAKQTPQRGVSTWPAARRTRKPL